ncbi:hypothetical protein ACIOG8_27840 [Streptomyces erythrochromogenes]|uniref:hypothetical protein n=1 Tax=Streptomyces erythrochromogenes TaxID=285574 RepID=UPI0038153860
MSAAAPPTAEATLAEQTRSVLARAVSLTVTTNGLRYDLVGTPSTREARCGCGCRPTACRRRTWRARRAEPWPR